MSSRRSRFKVTEEQRERKIHVTKIALANFSREPFLNVLALVLACEPTPDQVVAFAAKHPDRWAQAIAILARLSGFHEKLEITGNIQVDIQSMGDAQLLQKLQELRSTFGTGSIPDSPKKEYPILIEHKP